MQKDVQKLRYIVCAKRISLFAELLLRRSGSSKGGGFRYLDALVNKVPAGHTKKYVLLEGVQPTRRVRQSSIKRSCWPALFIHTN